ncbi:MAG: FtsX-like permease family protein [Myxococcales bacterium]|nr:FtsX-like permease family protein [Myxococcales bacterium]
MSASTTRDDGEASASYTSDITVQRPIEPPPPRARATGRRARRSRRRALLTLAVRMLLHDRLKLAGILVGVVFATVLAGQQAGTFLGLLRKNTMFVANAGADIWIMPPSTRQFQAGDTISDAALTRARAVAGVAWAAPLWLGGATIKLPQGGAEQVQLVGIDMSRRAGGPWNLVGGDVSKLALPDAMVFEDAERERLGGLNIGSLREINGHRVRVVGFTWGLLPFGPSYAFASERLAREVLKVEQHRLSYVMVGASAGVAPDALAKRLQRQLANVKVITRESFIRNTVSYVLLRTPIGVTFGSSALFGLLVGLVIVGLTMFSAVVDNVREFGTLKAIGARNGDLALLLVGQAIAVALVGALIGLAIVGRIATAVRSPKLALDLPWPVLATLVVVMILLCVVASLLALSRVRRLEPGLVFRG